MMLWKLANLWNFNQINSGFSQFITKHKIRHIVQLQHNRCDLWCCISFESFWSSGGKLDDLNSILQVVISKLSSQIALGDFHWRKELFTRMCTAKRRCLLFAMINQVGIVQLCPTRVPRVACGPVEGFVRFSLGFRCSKSILYSDNLSSFWYSWILHFWCRWFSVPLYHVCYCLS